MIWPSLTPDEKGFHEAIGVLVLACCCMATGSLRAEDKGVVFCGHHWNSDTTEIECDTENDLATTLAADLRRLSVLRQLKRLSLTGARNLKDLSPLQSLERLEDLDLSGTGVEDISPLGKLSTLRKLSLGCKVHDLQPLSALTALDELRLCGKGIKNLLPLGKLHKLKILHIAWMTDLDVKAISKLAGLQNDQTRPAAKNCSVKQMGAGARTI